MEETAKNMICEVTVYFRPSVLKALDSSYETYQRLHDIDNIVFEDGFVKLVSSKRVAAHMYPTDVIKSIEVIQDIQDGE